MSATEVEREHLSATALRQLMTCPLQYRLQRIDGVPPSHRSPSLVLGGVYHGTLATALLSVMDDKDVTVKQMVEWFEDGWAAQVKLAEPPIKWSKKITEDNLRELGRALVEAWHAQALPIFMEAESIIAVELAFSVPIFNSDGEVLRMPIDGYIDCVYRTTDGKVVVVDHKTASQKFGDAAIETEIQPTIYAHAVRFLGIDDDPVFHYHVMSKAKKPKLTVVEVPRGEGDSDRLDWICGQADRLISSGIYLPTAPDWKCESCEYAHACRRAHAEIVVPDEVAVPAERPSPEPVAVA